MNKALFFIALAVVIIMGALFVFRSQFGNITTEETLETPLEVNTVPMDPMTINPVEHASAVITWGDASLYIDPVGPADTYASYPRPTIVLLTDIHGDHLSPDTLQALVSSDTELVAPQAVFDKLPAQIASSTRVLANGEKVEIDGFTIEAIPMYNMPEAADAFHVKGRGNGYVIEKDGYRLYVAGDTAGTPEMRALTDIDFALVPMNLPYTMTVEDAADAVLAFRPKKVSPYHYRGPQGLSDVNLFKDLVTSRDAGIEVVFLNWYPTKD